MLVTMFYLQPAPLFNILISCIFALALSRHRFPLPYLQSIHAPHPHYSTPLSHWRPPLLHGTYRISQKLEKGGLADK